MSIEDKAQEQEIAEWERRQRVTPRKTYTPDDKEYGPAQCTECDAGMPAERRADGQRLCTECKSLQEWLDKRFMRR